MKNYKYTAIDLQKKKYTGLFMAEDEKDLAEQLAAQNLFLLSCSLYSGKTPSAFFTMGTGKVSVSELTMFCRQFAIMVNSGISVLECLESLKNQAFSKFFRNLIQVVYEDVKSGIMLSDALDKHQKVFPEFFRSMVHVGEAGGNLDTVLNSLADYYDKDLTIRKKVKSALSYPIMLCGLTVAIVVLMLVFVIPTFKGTLSDLNVSPQGFTKVVYDVSDFLVANWLKILAGIIVFVLLIFFILKTRTGALFFDKLKVTTPLVKNVTVSLYSARFARAFSLLIASGLDIVDAMNQVLIVLGNKDVKIRFQSAIEEVKHGMPLVMAFEKFNLFPSIMLQMVAVGEKTASLDSILARSCDFFDEQSESMLLSLTGKIQPVMLLILGVVVGTLFVAVYSPILSIMTTLI